MLLMTTKILVLLFSLRLIKMTKSILIENFFQQKTWDQISNKIQPQYKNK